MALLINGAAGPQKASGACSQAIEGRAQRETFGAHSQGRTSVKYTE